MICCECKNSFLISNIKKCENFNLDKCSICNHMKCQNCDELDKIINYMHLYKNLSIDNSNIKNYQNDKKKKYNCFKCFIL